MLQVNLKTRSPVQTTENYNSMCCFGNSFIGATEEGLYLIGGYTDSGAEIPARIKSGMFDLGLNNEKRFRFFYFGIETNGDLILTIFCEGIEAAQYAVSKKTGVQNIKVPISKAHQGRYWQWQLENVDGSFFVQYSVKGLSIILHR